MLVSVSLSFSGSQEKRRRRYHDGDLDRSGHRVLHEGDPQARDATSGEGGEIEVFADVQLCLVQGRLDLWLCRLVGQLVGLLDFLW